MAMVNYLATPGDSWQLVLRQGILRYSYTATGEPMAGLSASTAVIDLAGRLHIVATLLNKRLIYARWQGHRWESRELPANGSVLAFVLDSRGQPHLLLEESYRPEIVHLYLAGNRWQRQFLPFNLTAPPLLFKPLPRGRLFFAGQDASRGRQLLFLTVYDPATGWQMPRPLTGVEPGNKIYAYWFQGYLYLLSWHRQEKDSLLFLHVVEPEKNTSLRLCPGTMVDLPDDRPVLLAKEKTLLFLWTSSNRLAFCFSQDGGSTWSPPQSAYFFFPARIKAVEGPEGPSTRQVVFTKISGLEPDWPLVINFEPLFSLCRAVVVNPSSRNTPFKQ
ncbi:MAG: hypothetical protein PWR22_1422 [Moorella sp. (in: firmicutes)]|nr:hypothetical protein [Moorella sp. (in: firmicutes)]